MRSFINVYPKAQVALQETLWQQPVVEQKTSVTLPLLREADVETVVVAAGSAAVGKLIRELQLRTQSGASIIGIDRHGQSIINPGPDEEILAGDQILLLGNASQLNAAKAMLGNSNFQ